MDLLVVRHAVAEEREAFAKTAKDDAERPLTAEGRRKFEKGARGLRRLVDSIDVLATSFLVRAVQTGEILEEAYGIDRPARLRELAPDADPSSLVPWLRRQRRRSLVAIVGHEPHLSAVVEYLLTGRRAQFVDLRKGGACLLSFGEAPRPGHAELRWLVTAGQLRRLGR
ncbi:MAG TPA: histidine phosphatase family protein [Anaeromyxobacter sp.]